MRQRNKKRELQARSFPWNDGMTENREGYRAMVAGVCLIWMIPGTSVFLGSATLALDIEGAQEYGG